MFSKLFTTPVVELPAPKTIDTIIQSFTSVVADLKEVQGDAQNTIIYANAQIKALEDDISDATKDLDRAGVIIGKIEGLLA